MLVTAACSCQQFVNSFNSLLLRQSVIIICCNINKQQDKHRRLWRLAVATQPPIAAHQSAPCPTTHHSGPPISAVATQPPIAVPQSAPCPDGTRIHQKPTASSEGAQLWDNRPLTLSWFRDAGPTIVLNIIRDVSVPLRGTIFRWRCRTYPQLRCFAACSGFHDIGPAPRNSQL